VLARERELRLAQWQRPIAREFLRLFPEGFERGTRRKGLRSRHERPPFINRLCPAETRLKEGAIALDSDHNRWECSLAAGRWRPVSALPAVAKNRRLGVKRDPLREWPRDRTRPVTK